jgi:hypothetical protein
MTAGTSRQVYCTNWRSGETGTFRDFIEVYGQQQWTNVVRCRITAGKGIDAARSCIEVASGIGMANGIALAPGRAFVVASLTKELLIFERGDERGGAAADALTLLRRVATPAACDNLILHGSSLVSGCHPKALTFVAHSKSPTTKPAPCQVLRIDGALGTREQLEGGAAVTLSTLYLDSIGTEFAACSVAAAWRGSLVLGAVHDVGILECPKVPITE